MEIRSNFKNPSPLTTNQIQPLKTIVKKQSASKWLSNKWRPKINSSNLPWVGQNICINGGHGNANGWHPYRMNKGRGRGTAPPPLWHSLKYHVFGGGIWKPRQNRNFHMPTYKNDEFNARIMIAYNYPLNVRTRAIGRCGEGATLISVFIVVLLEWMEKCGQPSWNNIHIPGD